MASAFAQVNRRESRVGLNDIMHCIDHSQVIAAWKGKDDRFLNLSSAAECVHRCMKDMHDRTASLSIHIRFSPAINCWAIWITKATTLGVLWMEHQQKETLPLPIISLKLPKQLSACFLQSIWNCGNFYACNRPRRLKSQTWLAWVERQSKIVAFINTPCIFASCVVHF